MIDVLITNERVKITGHAGYAPCGSDIVCAGVTALADTLAMSLEYLTEDIITIDDGQGLMDIKFENLSKDGSLLISSFVIGITAIAESYSDYVFVRDDRPSREA